jgi:NitT/TauT family transport system substrate-binding protein
MLVARSKGADVVALMSIYANTGQSFYWLKSYGVDGAKTFPGHKIGNPPGDASRVMWPAFAKAAGIAPDSVNFVNVGPTAKIAALKSHTVDIISDFYNEHDLKVIEFGSDLGFVNWKDIGLNPYGNSLIVNGAFLEKNPKLAEDFVRISQKAFAACVADVAPCLKALLDQVSGLDKEKQERQWERIKFLMTDEFTTTKALGWIDPGRMQKDYELVQTYLGMEKPFAVETAFTTKLLDSLIKMDASIEYELVSRVGVNLPCSLASTAIKSCCRLCRSQVHVSHRTRPGGVFRSKPQQIETGRAYEVVHLPVQMATSRNMAPNGGESVLPALDSRLG